MGVSGLLPMLKEIQVHGHISEFRGKRLAVDAYVWLHKGAFGCAEALVKGQKTTRFVDYAMHRVRLLRYHGITPYIVFDGGPLPAKRGTEVSRAKSRAESLAKAQSLESQGRSREARESYTKCLDITPEMAFQLIKALRAENVDYVVAPYEADAQLCFLEREGFVDGIITEDSDLLVFGCDTVIFKLDGNGECVSIHRDRFAAIQEFPMHGWTDFQFRRMAMLAGCDYLPSIPGIGVKTAHRLLRRHKTVEKLLQSVRLEGTHNVPLTYATDFAQAELAFIHQRVFHPILKRLVPLNDFPEEGLGDEDEKWIGLELDAEIAQGMARGDIHPETKLSIEDLWPDYIPVARGSLKRSASSPKRILRESGKANVVSGPLDAFVCRAKRTKSAPSPKPIGVMSSGPSRLSDQHLFNTSKAVGTSRFNNEDGGDLPVKTSKFFSSRKGTVAQHLEEAVCIEANELVWERSDDIGLDIESQPAAGPPRRSHSPDEDHVRSPSPIVSSFPKSPLKLGLGQQNESPQMTSPEAPHLSSPAMSSPPRDDDDPFSPLPLNKERAASPTSPTPKQKQQGGHVLVEPSSQTIPTSQVLVGQTPARKERAERDMSRLTSVLVPGSSPQGTSLGADVQAARPLDLRRACGITGPSSDSMDDEEVVTPSAEALGKRRMEENDDEGDRRRKERAKVVAAGWKAMYTFNADMSFPAPRSTRVIKTSQTTVPRVKCTTPKAVSNASDPSTCARVLVPRQMNIVTVNDSSTSEKATLSKSPEKKRSPTSMHEPVSSGRSSLDKFRFVGKVIRTD